ncbi:MAG: indole-3-glycerol phosphate synthase TrpC [Deltaproteobacteria bacterium]|nr:MAG: indole-3-glycerol phosphate synthase TrpC [Deltaproteobacteria bacterium]
MILDDIVARKKEQVFQLKQRLSQAELDKAVVSAPKPRDFISALRSGTKPAIIAEIKRASPSAGLIRDDLDVMAIAADYEKGGAAAVSVITEEDFFQGRLEYLEQTRAAVSLPLLCKDFIFDPIQILTARAAGADAVLLITAILAQDLLVHLLRMACSLGMSCLVEVHDAEELARVIETDARIIGINNRDLKTFKVDLDTTLKLCSSIPPDRVVVSESGIQRHKDLQNLAAAGVNAVLVGTSLMRADDPGRKLRELMGR